MLEGPARSLARGVGLFAVLLTYIPSPSSVDSARSSTSARPASAGRSSRRRCRRSPPSRDDRTPTCPGLPTAALGDAVPAVLREHADQNRADPPPTPCAATTSSESSGRVRARESRRRSWERGNRAEHDRAQRADKAADGVTATRPTTIAVAAPTAGASDRAADQAASTRPASPPTPASSSQTRARRLLAPSASRR